MVWPTLGVRLRYGYSDAADHVVMAAFEKQAALAVEPMTHAADGFRLLEDCKTGGIDVIVPGSSLQITYTFRASLDMSGAP